MTPDKVIEIAVSQLSYKEQAVNRTKFGKWYGVDGVPWCATFVSWVFAQAGLPLKIESDKGFKYCPYGVDWFKKEKKWYTSNPKKGDIVFYDWYPRTTKSGAYHVGIVEEVRKNSIISIEGNTSLSSNDNGGAVMRRERSFSLVLGYGRVSFPAPIVNKIAYDARALVDGKTVEAYLIDNKLYVKAESLDKYSIEDWIGKTKTGVLKSK